MRLKLHSLTGAHLALTLALPFFLSFFPTGRLSQPSSMRNTHTHSQSLTMGNPVNDAAYPNILYEYLTRALRRYSQSYILGLNQSIGRALHYILPRPFSSPRKIPL